jgi:hypothetical protein
LLPGQEARCEINIKDKRCCDLFKVRCFTLLAGCRLAVYVAFFTVSHTSLCIFISRTLSVPLRACDVTPSSLTAYLLNVLTRARGHVRRDSGLRARPASRVLAPGAPPTAAASPPLAALAAPPTAAAWRGWKGGRATALKARPASRVLAAGAPTRPAASLPLAALPAPPTAATRPPTGSARRRRRWRRRRWGWEKGRREQKAPSNPVAREANGMSSWRAKAEWGGEAAGVSGHEGRRALPFSRSASHCAIVKAPFQSAPVPAGRTPSPTNPSR